jgi:hypothetical protein
LDKPAKRLPDIKAIVKGDPGRQKAVTAALNIIKEAFELTFGFIDINDYRLRRQSADHFILLIITLYPAKYQLKQPIA